MTDLQKEIERLRWICAQFKQQRTNPRSLDDLNAIAKFHQTYVCEVSVALPRALAALDVARKALQKMYSLECGNCARGPEYSSQYAKETMREIEKIMLGDSDD